MYLNKRNGVYYIVYKKEDGKRTSKSTKRSNKKEAYRVLLEFEEELLTGRKKLDNTISIGAYRFEFLRYSEAMHSYRTARDYSLTMRKFIEFIGNLPIVKIDSLLVEKYIQHCIKNRSIHQARKDLINLKALFNKAVKDGYLTESPCKNIKRIKVPEKLPLFYTKEEYQKLISVIDNKDILDIVKFALNTGMRQGEIINLQWSNVDLNNRMVILDNQTHLTKSRRIRSVPLNSNVIELLIQKPRVSVFVFTYNGEKIKQDLLVHRFKKYVRLAKLNDKLNFHSLRHTFASWLVQKGVSIYVISKLLGHADIKTTEIYAHLSTNTLSCAVEDLI